MTIDAWMQHPTVRFSEHEMFDSLRRWTGQQALTQELPIAMTIAAMDHAGVDFALLSAWHAPREGKRIPPELVAYMQSGSGARKVLYGSNYPMIMPQAALADLDALGLDEQAREMYLADNARRVFALA